MNIRDETTSTDYEVTDTKWETYMWFGSIAVDVLAYYLKDATAEGTEPTKVLRVLVHTFEDVPLPEEPPEE